MAAQAFPPDGGTQPKQEEAGSPSSVEPDRTRAPPTEEAPKPGLMAQVQALWRSLPGLVGDRVELFALELKRASRALGQVVVLVVVIAVLGVTTWLLIWAALVGALVGAGLSPPLALLVAVIANVAVMFWALARMQRLLPTINLPATRRHLMPAPSSIPAAPAASAQPAVPAGAAADLTSPSKLQAES